MQIKQGVYIFCLLTLLINFSTSTPEVDLVGHLPGYPFQGRMYSGYLNVDNPKKKLHYLFIESGNDPRNDPLVLWLNGGPGCSSMLGWAQEHGPASMQEASDKFVINPYSWHKKANVVYLESPAGVGFSYIDSIRKEDLYIDDHISGRENLQALVDFFKKFPTFRNNDFYIAGESYGGIYVPTLATNVLEYNRHQVSSRQIKLKGIIVGNGVTDWQIDTTNAFLDFAYTHALYSPEVRMDFNTYCKTSFDENKCKETTEKIMNGSKTVNMYDIYRSCFRTSGDKTNNFTINSDNYKKYNYTPWLFKGPNFNKNESSQTHHFLAYLGNDQALTSTPPCVDSLGPDSFFNNIDVKKALNVRTDLTWGMCSESVGERYKVDEKGSFYLYPNLIKSKIKILIYSGDTDGAVPYNGSQKWISNLDLPVKSSWRSWKVDGESDLAGYRTIYDGLTFVTIKGTGHMVPQWKPKEAFHMFSHFISGKDL